MQAYFANFIKGINAVFEKGKLRRCCFLCSREIGAEELETGRESLNKKIELMQSSQRKQEAKVAQVQGQVDRLKRAKRELVRLQELHDQTAAKRKAKEALATRLVEAAQNSTPKLLGEARKRSAELKEVQNEAIQLEDKRRELREFFNVWREACERVFQGQSGSATKVRFWEKLNQMRTDLVVEEGPADFFKRYYGARRGGAGRKALVIAGDLKVGLEAVLKLDLVPLDVQVDRSLAARLREQMQEQVQAFQSDPNSARVRSGLGALHRKLEQELRRAKAKVFEGVQKAEQKAQEKTKHEKQIELLRKEVGDLFSGSELERILKNEGGLLEKTELQLRTMLAEVEAGLGELRAREKEVAARLRGEAEALDEKLSRVEEYQARFERVQRHPEVAASLRIKKALEGLLRETSRDIEAVRSRVRAEELAAEIGRGNEEINECVAEIAKKRELVDKAKRVEKQKSEYQSQKSSLLGQKSLLLRKCRELLQSIAEAREAEREYLKQLCRHDLLGRNKAVQDRLALEIERETHEYHVSRIQRINEYINRIWRHTYESRDILEVFIELSDSGKKHSLKKNFNYKLMGRFFGGQRSELKGRCSAGQKMMVSIVVRLALAEAFCARCKIISLDEPTTNLDRANASHLAEFLKGFLERDETQVR